MNLNKQLESCKKSYVELGKQIELLQKLIDNQAKSPTKEKETSLCGKYEFNRINGKLTCSCPAFTFQKAPKTPCKHLQAKSLTKEKETFKLPVDVPLIEGMTMIMAKKLTNLENTSCKKCFDIFSKYTDNEGNITRLVYTNCFYNEILNYSDLRKALPNSQNKLIMSIFDTLSINGKVKIEHLICALSCLCSDYRSEKISFCFNLLGYVNSLPKDQLKTYLICIFKMVSLTKSLSSSSENIATSTLKEIIKLPNRNITLEEFQNWYS